MSLTDLTCKRATPRIKPYKLSDSSGLYLEISPKGHKWWRLKYAFNGTEKRLSLGVYPDVTLFEARTKRDELKKQLASGIDPSFARRESKLLATYKASQTVELVAREMLAKKKREWSDSYWQDCSRRLEADIFPWLGTLPVDRLTPPMLFNRLQEIEKRSKDQAKRVTQLMGQVLRFCVVTGRAERDFTRDFKGAFQRIARKNFAAITPDEISAFLTELENPNLRSFPITIIVTKIMMHTFVRTSELIKMKRKELDLVKGEWVIPAERMKKRREHLVPLSSQVVELFLSINLTDDPDGYVFKGIHFPTKHISNGTILKMLARMGYKGKMTGHGFRALAKTSLVEKLGYADRIASLQLAHLIKDQTERAYNRAQFIPERTKMMQDWSNYLDKLS